MQTEAMAVLAAAALYFLAISVAVRRHFDSAAMPPGMALISGLSLAAFARTAWCLATVPVPAERGLSAIALIACAAFLFASAIRHSGRKRLALAYDPRRPELLVVTGPYRHVRHPFYVSYAIYWSACAFATADYVVALLGALLVGLYYAAARREEASFAGSELAEAYASYAQRTGMFLPRFPWELPEAGK